MRHEHKSHVFVISLMLIVILFVFSWVLLRHFSSSGENSGITTSLSAYSGTSYTGAGYSNAVSAVDSLQTEKQVLYGLLIILVGMGIFYLALKITHHFKNF